MESIKVLSLTDCKLGKKGVYSSYATYVTNNDNEAGEYNETF